MKLNIKIVLATITGIAVATWVLTGFVMWDWNPRSWPESVRFLFVFFWFAYTAVILAYILDKR